MTVTVITPSFNSGAYIRECIESVLRQREDGVDIQYLVIDGGSTDNTLEILASYGDAIDRIVSEPDQGPADAINKGFALARGDLVAWLNADDVYAPGALRRVLDTMTDHADAAFCFGYCPIVDTSGAEIRKGVTQVKEFFYPLSCRFTFQCINYISQPALFFRREALEKAGPLRLDLKAAWDYEFILRLWRQGRGRRVPRPELARFRWHERSISGQHFVRQFNEEFEAAREDAGRFSLQTLLHAGVRAGILFCYRRMNRGAA